MSDGVNFRVSDIESGILNPLEPSGLFASGGNLPLFDLDPSLLSAQQQHHHHHHHPPFNLSSYLLSSFPTQPQLYGAAASCSSSSTSSSAPFVPSSLNEYGAAAGGGGGHATATSWSSSSPPPPPSSSALSSASLDYSASTSTSMPPDTAAGDDGEGDNSTSVHSGNYSSRPSHRHFQFSDAPSLSSSGSSSASSSPLSSSSSGRAPKSTKAIRAPKTTGKRRARTAEENQNKQTLEKKRRAELSDAVNDLKLILCETEQDTCWKESKIPAGAVVQKAADRLRQLHTSMKKMPSSSPSSSSSSSSSELVVFSNKRRSKANTTSSSSSSSSSSHSPNMKQNGRNGDAFSSFSLSIGSDFSSVAHSGCMSFRLKFEAEGAYIVDTNTLFDMAVGYHSSVLANRRLRDAPLHSATFLLPSLRQIDAYNDPMKLPSMSCSSILSVSSDVVPLSDIDFASPTMQTVLNDGNCDEYPYPCPFSVLSPIPPDSMRCINSSGCPATCGSKWSPFGRRKLFPREMVGVFRRGIRVPIIMRLHTSRDEILEIMLHLLRPQENEKDYVSAVAMVYPNGCRRTKALAACRDAIPSSKGKSGIQLS